MYYFQSILHLVASLTAGDTGMLKIFDAGQQDSYMMYTLYLTLRYPAYSSVVTNQTRPEMDSIVFLVLPETQRTLQPARHTQTWPLIMFYKYTCSMYVHWIAIKAFL